MTQCCEGSSPPSRTQLCTCIAKPPHPCLLQEDVVGLRTPYLDTDTAVREVLHENGFLYEAALIEDW